ncbi:hypothetical protein KR093_007636 [Drosophila rubida]|uniref:Uncharacterized protein n=1 Tax=Drosophila rubida TaxID=30044 RepID=A0AAD4PN71_9MUSC|nr:hypothetical protein KR093_001563 [Drosophila rubida]KAH8376833.1 hypothetical protein KR093_001562 [Drosophila rubida]KAH8377874.1 hypothetical protein KR093_007636 [Drosophila rubida]
MRSSTASLLCAVLAVLALAQLPLSGAVTCEADPTAVDCVDCTLLPTDPECAATTAAPTTAAPATEATTAAAGETTTAAAGTDTTTAASDCPSGGKKRITRKFKATIKPGKKVITRRRKGNKFNKFSKFG